MRKRISSFNERDEKRKDKYQYLLNLADDYIKKQQELMALQDKNWNEWRQEEINRLDKKIEKILADYERFSHEYENGSKTENKEVWVEYLYDGAWIMRISGDKLLGYLVRNDPCCFSEDDEPYEEGLVPTFAERAEEMGLEPVEIK